MRTRKSHISKSSMQIFVAVLIAGAAACSPAPAPERQAGPGYLALESSDPLAPARLYQNTFEMQSSWDPGNLDLMPVVYPANIDFGVFLRDCRRDASLHPLHFMLRDPGRCPENIDGLVMAHGEGAGVVSRFWMTALDPLSERQWDNERIAVYVDGERRFSASLAGLAAGKWPPGWPGERISGCLVSYAAIAFGHDVWVVLEGARAKMYYYQIDLVRGEMPRAARPSAGSAYVDSMDVSLGTVDVYRGAAGAVTAIAFSGTVTAMNAAQVSFGFDGVTSALDVRDLCNASYGWAAFATQRIKTTLDASLNVTCTLGWGMPHSYEGRISVTANDGAVHVDVASTELPEDAPAGRFYAYSVVHDTDANGVTWADLEGRGRLAAVLVDGEAEEDDAFLTPDPLNWLESDEILFIDGEMRAHGTGTEDFFNGGFYFNDGPFARSFGGVSVVGETDTGWGRAQMARYFLGADQINFQHRFRATWEVVPVKHSLRLTPIFYLEP